MKNKKFKIYVDCANCASKMEEALKKDPAIQDCSIAFMTQKLSVAFDDSIPEQEMKDKIIKICKKVDDDFEIV